MIEVELTESEMMQAAVVGTMRHFESITNGRGGGYVCNHEESLARHINGAGGEIAVAKFSGRYWGGHVNRFRAGDIGERVQVKTRSRHDWQLIVRPEAVDEHAYVLVTGTGPKYCIRGWIMAKDAKRREWLADHGGTNVPAYFVPQSDLRPMTKAAA